MPSIYELLAGGIKSKDDFLKEDPYYMSGVSLARAPQIQPTTSNEAFLGPILQGLIQGGMLGYGEKRANEAGYDYYKNLDLLRGQSGRPTDLPIGPLTQEQALSDYTQENAPSGWTLDLGKSAYLGQLLKKQVEDERKLQEAKDLAAYQRMLGGKGRILNPVTGEITNAPGALAALQEEEKIKGTYNSKGTNVKVNTGGLEVETSKDVGKANALVDEALATAEQVETSGMNWAQWQGSGFFSKLDPDAIHARATQLADTALRSVSGAAAPPAERAEVKKFVEGDISADTEIVAKFMRRYANTINSQARSRLDMAETLQKGGIPAAKELLKGKMYDFGAKKTSTTIGGDASKKILSSIPPGYRDSGMKDAMGSSILERIP